MWECKDIWYHKGIWRGDMLGFLLGIVMGGCYD